MQDPQIQKANCIWDFWFWLQKHKRSDSHPSAGQSWQLSCISSPRTGWFISNYFTERKHELGLRGVTLLVKSAGGHPGLYLPVHSIIWPHLFLASPTLPGIVHFGTKPRGSGTYQLGLRLRSQAACIRVIIYSLNWLFPNRCKGSAKLHL
jgi:hypothetical protein